MDETVSFRRGDHLYVALRERPPAAVAAEWKKVLTPALGCFL